MILQPEGNNLEAVLFLTAKIHLYNHNPPLISIFFASFMKKTPHIYIFFQKSLVEAKKHCNFATAKRQNYCFSSSVG